MNKRRLFKLSKGYRGRAKNCYTIALRRVQKGLSYSYRDRQKKKTTNRQLWIQRINNSIRFFNIASAPLTDTTPNSLKIDHNLNYSKFMHQLALNNIILNRKMLAVLAIQEPITFKNLVKKVQINIEK